MDVPEQANGVLLRVRGLALPFPLPESLYPGAAMALQAWFLQVYLCHLPPSDFTYFISFPSSSSMLFMSCLQISKQAFHKPFSVLQTHPGFYSCWRL